jgi:3-keto-5-aminohexanoate cleavage enzyme
MARSNGELVAKARQMTLDAGRRPATVQEARARLGLPARPRVASGEALPA